MTDELYIGLMSGTSMDGIDAVVLEIGKNEKMRIRSTASRAFSDDVKKRLRKLIKRKISDPAEAQAQGIISDAEAALLREAADATRTAIMVDDFAPEEIGKKGVERSAPQPPRVAMSM